MTTSIVRRGTSLALLATFSVGSLTGCASLTNKERGAVIGAGAGGAVGAAVGSRNGSTARGAIIGAVVGGAAGAIIGHQMDQQAKRLEQSIPGATVARVGEGIVVTFDSGLLYDFNSERVRPAARENLTNLANSLSAYPNTDVMLIGHTDAVGDDAYNQALSLRRARAAQEVLVAQGVTPSRLQVLGRGESEPVASNETDAGRAENRRVEVVIVANDQLQAQARRQAGS